MSVSVRPSWGPPAPLRVLVASTDRETLRVVQVSAQGEAVEHAANLAAVVAADAPDLAFVDLGLPGGAGLAAVYHLAASSPECSIHVIASVAELAQAAEAMSLGASGMIVGAPTGDAILVAVQNVRARRAARARLAALEAERAALAEQFEILARAVRVARAGDGAALAEALTGLLAVAAGARGVALFGTEPSPGAPRPRLGAFGTALAIGVSYTDSELANTADARGVSLLPILSEERSLGVAWLDRPDPQRAARLAEVADVCGAMLALAQASRAALEHLPTAPRSRGLPLDTVARLLDREIAAASGEERAFALLHVVPEGREPVDPARLSQPLAEKGSAVGIGAAGEAVVVLPQTPPLAALAIVSLVPYRGVGIAAFPADGRSAARLLRLAEARARLALASPVHAHGLSTLPLAEIVRALLDRPTLEGRISDVFPLELTEDAARSVVEFACRHAARRPCRVDVAGEPALGLVRAARVGAGAEHVRAHALSAVSGCEGVQIVVVQSELGAWTLVGTVDGAGIRAAHSSDPLLAALVAARLERAGSLSVPPPRVEVRR